MSDNSVIVDIPALEELIRTLEVYINEMEAVVREAIENIKNNQNEWNDEDFEKLLEGINVFNKELDAVKFANLRIIERARQKIEAIDQIHQTNI